MRIVNWTSQALERGRWKRLLTGQLVGALIMGGVLLGLSSSLAGVRALAAPPPEEEEVLEATLAAALPEPEPEPEPAPPPSATRPPEPARRAPATRRTPELSAPTALPTAPLKEAEPSANVDAAAGDPLALASADAPSAVEPSPTVAPAPESPRARIAESGPAHESDVDERATPLSGNAKPPYPPEAKSAGVEGVVFVRFVVGVDGVVRNVKVLKGPEVFWQVCVATLMAWRFEPARKDGKPVEVVRTARIPFRIRA